MDYRIADTHPGGGVSYKYYIKETLAYKCTYKGEDRWQGAGQGAPKARAERVPTARRDADRE